MTKPNDATENSDAKLCSTSGPSKEWVKAIAEIEDSFNSVSVGGMAADTGLLPDDEYLCQICFVGFYLPSGRCDHCNLLRPSKVR